ncbi:MAG: hypothetical protein IJ845_03095 [Bacteroidaceae bacterium]|nr:hypothetical protein [Bacteroidaceae bacterium]
MKTKNLLLSLCCTAALTACTTNDEPAVAPAMRTVTLSVEVAEPAGTRAEYTETETAYQFAWTDDDYIRVYYNEGGEEKDAMFKIKTFSGKQAEFDVTLPTTVTNVSVTYGYLDGGATVPVTGVTTVTDDVASALKDRTILYAENVAVTADGLANVKLQHAGAYLLLRSGLQVVNSEITTDYSFALAEMSYYTFAISSDGITKRLLDGVKKFNSSVISGGKLTSDVLVSFYVDPAGESLALPFQVLDSSNTPIGSATQPSHTYKPGVIYEVKANNTSWVAATEEK